LVQKSTGKTPTKRTKVVLGFDNEVYRVKTQDGPNFIARIHRFGEIKPSQEVWAMEQSRKAGVPVPEVFFAGSINLPDGEHEAMVLSEVDGKPLSEIKSSLSKPELDRAHESAGQVLRNIHSIKAGGFYHRQPDGVWDFSTWESFIESAIKGRSAERSTILDSGFSDDDFDFMINRLRFYGEEFPCHQPVLNHGDYEAGHIFVDKGLNVSGIIDFGMFQGAPAIHDFAFFTLFSKKEPLANLEALIRGYGKHEMFDDRFELRLNLHMLSLQMGHLAHEAKQGNDEDAKMITERLQRTLNTLKELKNGS